jgi:hypothetical protein
LSNSELYVHDIDLGDHATYEVVLTQKENSAAEFSKAFNIVPSNGYQRQSFSISVLNTDMIDFENEIWQTFEIEIRATEIYEKDHQTSKSFTVQLVNWNDELPIFDFAEYTFEVLETANEDSLVGVVRATDRDIGDRIE